MERLRSQWGRGDVKGRAAALRGWSLLFTSLGALPSGNVVESLLVRVARMQREATTDCSYNNMCC